MQMGASRMGLLKLAGLVCVLAMVDFAGSAVTVHLLEAPGRYSRLSNAVFRYSVKMPNGTNACDGNSCSFGCELDGYILRSCPAEVVRLKDLTVNKWHTFLLNVTTRDGERASSSYSWFVDTIPPTASISNEVSYTNAGKVTLDVRFSEPCSENGSFKCLNSSNCDVIVTGPANIQPSSLRTVNRGMAYKLDIIISSETEYGRVIVRMADNFCKDRAGNSFTRTNSSTAVIHFDRRPLMVDLWMPVPSYALKFNGVLRTVLATNKMEDLKIFLDFSSPIRNSTEQVLGVLSVNYGTVVPVHGGNHGNRKFMFELKNISDTRIVTVKLDAGLLVGRTGTHVSPVSSATVLYDSKPPKVGVSTNAPSTTKASEIDVIVEFTKPVFGFDGSTLEIQGGTLTRFKEISKALYSLRVLLLSGNVVSIAVPGGKVNDISGNQNLISNRLEVTHYSTPAISLALHSFVTAGLVATSLATAALSLSSANLVAIGILAPGNTNTVASSSPMNLHGLIGHLQVFVLSEWFSANHPVEYSETTEGLKWLIPRRELPWKKDTALSLLDHAALNEQKSGKFRLGNLYHVRGDHVHNADASNSSSDQHQLLPQSNLGPSASGIRGLNMSMESSQYGLPLRPQEYFMYFMRGEPLSARSVVKRIDKYTGWKDLDMNLFWLGLGAGTMFVIHGLILVFLRWRTRTTALGILSVPRFELLLLVLSLPNISQSSAFVIRGGTMGGFIVGMLLLVIPAAFIVSVCLFLAFVILSGNLAQYKEIRDVTGSEPWYRRPWFLLTGKQVTGKWFYRQGLPSDILPRFGILFEDRKGPPVFVYTDQNDPSVTSNWMESGQSGIGRMRAVSSEDSNLEFKVPTRTRLLGCARSCYIVIDLLRRVGLGAISVGFSSPSLSQDLLALSITAMQLIYLSTLRPYIRRGVHMAESISLICEVGIFSLSILTLDRPRSTTLGYLMLSLLFITFMAQITNEWYNLIRILLRLSPQRKSFRLGLKCAAKGLLLPFMPRKQWKKVAEVASEPKTGSYSVAPLSPERQSGRVLRSEQFSSMTATVVPVASPVASPSLVVPQAASSAMPSTQRGAGEGERRAAEKSEMKKLRRLAKASFSSQQVGEESTSSNYSLVDQYIYPETIVDHQASTSEPRH